jgi:methylglutaconyl-CoA hydratase
MTFQYLLTSRSGPVAQVVLNRPDVRNAFNDAMIDELARWAASIAADAAVRVAVVSGAGKAVCAGADLAWMSRTVSYTHEENVRDAAAGARMYGALDALPIPLIGRIHGAALGGGAGLAAVCDIVVAEESATFGFTEVKLGILPAMIAPFVLTKIGPSAARELFLTGRRFGAERAREIRLVHAIAPAAGLDAAVSGYVRDILGSGPEAIGAAKTLLRQIDGRTPAEVAAVTAEIIATRRASPEGQEGMKAFLEKRKATWDASS